MININNETFENYFAIALLDREEVENQYQIKKKKKVIKKSKSMSAAASKKKNFDTLNSKGDDSNFRESSSDSDEGDYEIEYIEKLKKIENTKILEKPLNIEILASEDFPLKLTHLLPFFHIMSFTSVEFSKLKSTLCSGTLPFNTFPLKTSFPLGLSFFALLQVTGFTTSSLDLNFYEVPQFNQSSNISEINVIDDNYANDFYEKYFLEKKQISHRKNYDGENASLDRSSELGTET